MAPNAVSRQNNVCLGSSLSMSPARALYATLDSGMAEAKRAWTMGQNFHICLRSGRKGLSPSTPPPPPVTVNLTIKYPCFFWRTPGNPNYIHILNPKCVTFPWIVAPKIVNVENVRLWNVFPKKILNINFRDKKYPLSGKNLLSSIWRVSKGKSSKKDGYYTTRMTLTYGL